MAPWSLAGIACAAGAMGEDERAARMFGAAEALREAGGYHITSREGAIREPFLKASRSRPRQAEWHAALAKGKGMTMEQAVEYALSEKGAAVPHSAIPPAQQPDLTRREQEIATLVARGLTNRQIASELVISEHSAATHIRRVLKKLGLRSRAQIGSWLTERHSDDSNT